MTVLVPLLFVVAPEPSIVNGIALQRLNDDVLVEAPLRPEDSLAVTRDVEAAYARLHDAFGADPTFRATVFVCRSARCKIAFGADPRAAHAADLGFAAVTFAGPNPDRAVVVTGPNASTAGVLAHELVHARMKSWAPYDASPTWFNEGLATAIADEPKCVRFGPSSELDVTALVNKADWQAFLEATGDTLRTYCQARYATEAWSAFAGMRELGAKARRAVSAARPGRR